jgi:hypothetical protein
MKKVSLLGVLAVAALSVAFAPSAQASESDTVTLADGVTQQTTYSIHLPAITSGQNRIRTMAVNGLDKPVVDGYITSFIPNLVKTSDGSIPSSSKVMFHHGVWFSLAGGGRGGPFFATGEEKTQMILPDGYGYPYKASDIWFLNEMIHNLTPDPMDLTVTYTINFIPDTAPEAASIKPALPIWMDVENGQNRGYPVFDVLRDSGGADGEFTYPEDAPDAYPPGVHINQWKAPKDGVLLGTTGHVHTGGLSTELFMSREGASYDGPTCDLPPNHDAAFDRVMTAMKKAKASKAVIKSQLKTKAIEKLKKSMKPNKAKRLKKSMRPAKFKKWKKAKQKQLKRLKKINAAKLRQLAAVNRRMKALASEKTSLEAKAAAEQKSYDDCTATVPTVEGNRVRLFESTAHYFEPAGPVSWDMAMVSTKHDWRVQVEAGDKLDLQATYETKIGSWYESMGINVIFWSPGEQGGRNPYDVKVDTPGILNHGHYPENDDHGGGTPLVGPDPSGLPDGPLATSAISIGPGFTYGQGDFRLPGGAGRPPVVKKGDSFTFALDPGDATKEIWHSLTSCKSPCNKSTGIAYPLPDGDFQFDSGQLGNLGGNAAPPTVGRTTWTTPANLPVGTHTYFCRIHPLMRGAFRVVKD